MRSNHARTAVLGFGIALAIGMAAPPTANAEAVELKLDQAHTNVGFKVRHLFTKVSGRFTDFEGSISFDEQNLANSALKASVEVASIDTDNDRRDEHLRSGDFFAAEEHPRLSFEGTGIEAVSATRGNIKGKLTIRGITRDVVLETEFLGKGKDPWGNLRYGFHAETTINRKDYGMQWNQALEAGGVMVGDEVEISLDIEAVLAD